MACVIGAPCMQRAGEGGGIRRRSAASLWWVGAWAEDEFEALDIAMHSLAVAFTACHLPLGGRSAPRGWPPAGCRTSLRADHAADASQQYAIMCPIRA